MLKGCPYTSNTCLPFVCLSVHSCLQVLLEAVVPKAVISQLVREGDVFKALGPKAAVTQLEESELWDGTKAMCMGLQPHCAHAAQLMSEAYPTSSSCCSCAAAQHVCHA